MRKLHWLVAMLAMVCFVVAMGGSQDSPAAPPSVVAPAVAPAGGTATAASAGAAVPANASAPDAPAPAGEEGPGDSALPPGAIQRLGGTGLRHTEQVSGVAVSPDGKRIASVSLGGVIFLWDAVTGRKLAAHGMLQSPMAVSFVGDGNTVAVALAGEVRVMDLSASGAGRSFATTQGAMQARFSRDGRVVAFGGQTGAWTWRVPEGNELGGVTVTGHILSMSLSPDGNSVIVTSWGAKPRAIGYVSQRWDAGAKKALWATTSPAGVMYTCHVFSPDGNRLAASGSDGKIALLDARNGVRQSSFNSGDRSQVLQGLAFTPDGTRIVGMSHNGDITVWDANGGARLQQVTMPQGSTQGLAVSPDGTFAATAGPGELVGLWDLATGKPRLAIHGHIGSLAGIAFGADAVFSAGNDGTVRRWDLASGKDELLMTLKDKQSQFLAISPDGTRAVSRSWGAQAEAIIWDVAAGASTGHMRMDGGAFAAAFTLDGQILALLGGHSVFLWHQASGRLVNQFEAGVGQNGAASGLALSPDAKMLAVGGLGSRLYEVASGKEAAPLAEAEVEIASLSYSPDGRRLAAVFGEKVTAYDLLTEANSVLVDGNSSAQIAAFSRDGRRLATGGPDGSILIWDVPAADRPMAGPPADANEMAGFWNALAGTDAEKAYRGGRRLVLEGPSAVAMLRSRLKPLAAASRPADLGKLLADLDNDSLRIRDEASRKLASFADEKLLRDALADAKSDEVRARLGDLLSELVKSSVRGDEDLRADRAVRVLEQIGSDAARELLATLAKGGPGRLTRDAGAALARLTAPATNPTATSRP